MNDMENPSHMIAERGMKSALLGIFVNLGLAVVKCVAGLLGHAFALVADGLESIMDVFGGLVVYFGLKIAVRPPDARYPYGRGKAEPMAAVIVSLSLITAALFILYQGVREVAAPNGLPARYTLVVLAGVLIVKELMFRHVMAVGESIGSSAVKTDAWRHRADALTSVFAFLGISIALLGGPGWEKADGIAAICAALVVLYHGCKQLMPALREIADVAPPPDVASQVREIAARVPGILGLDKCSVRKMGFHFYVDLHIVVSGEMSVREGHHLSHQVEDEVLKHLPQVAEVLVHVEPEEEMKR